jgi:hypothetical protein
MANLNLILTIPQGTMTATSLGIEGLARHRSPGSGKHFRGRKIYVDLALTPEGRPDFKFLDEGGWRETTGDTVTALEGIAGGKRTKTALSNNAFSCTPLGAHRACYLIKTGGDVLPLDPRVDLQTFAEHDCGEEMSPSEIARAVGRPEPAVRKPRLYMVLSPVELLLLSNLTPEEYAWYATHRPGKIFRQVAFTELRADQTQLAALSRYVDARQELERQPTKKTKTVVSEDTLNEVPFENWLGYTHEERHALYVADRERIGVWRFPSEIPRSWERAAG